MITNTKHLAQAVKLCAAAIGSRQGITSTLLLDHRDGTLTLTATDYDATVRCVVPTEGGNAWTVAAPAAALRDVVVALTSETVDLDAEGTGGLRVTAGGSLYRLTCMPAAEWPSVDVVDVPDDAPLLPDLAPLVCAMSRDESRPALNGVHLDGAVAVATDGHRLHTLTLPQPCDAGLLHRRGVELAQALPGPLRYAVDGRLVGIAGEGCTLTVRRIDEAFPTWQKVMPTGRQMARFDAGALRAGVRQVSALGSGKHSLMRLTIADGEIALEMTHPDHGDAHATGGAIEHPDVAVGVNPRYLLDALDALEAAGCNDEAELSIDDQFSPMLLVGGSARVVVMPCRL